MSSWSDFERSGEEEENTRVHNDFAALNMENDDDLDIWGHAYCF